MPPQPENAMINKLAIASALTAAATLSHAGVIVSAQSVSILVGAPGVGDIVSTYDTYGLLDDYVSGETDFDTYMASNPLHVADFNVVEGGSTYYYEWFSEYGNTAATVSYDLGSVQQTLGMALWNEDANGIGKLNVLGSVDGTTWTTLASNITPTNHAFNTDYGADVLSWGSTSARYIKLEMSACPAGGSWIGCSIGEVAFNVSPVPEPSSLAMTGLGLGLMGWVAASRRRKQA